MWLSITIYGWLESKLTKKNFVFSAYSIRSWFFIRENRNENFMDIDNNYTSIYKITGSGFEFSFANQNSILNNDTWSLTDTHELILMVRKNIHTTTKTEKKRVDIVNGNKMQIIIIISIDWIAIFCCCHTFFFIFWLILSFCCCCWLKMLLNG